MKTHLRLPLFTLFLSVLCFGFSADGWGQTTVIDFDDAGKWTAGSAGITSYAADHVYQDANWTFTGGPALRNGSGAQDGFPGALGTYSWRMQNVATVDWKGTYNGSGVIEGFGFSVRRWDGSPSPDVSIEYSINGGVNYTNTGVVIDNTYLDNSSAWKTFSFTLPAPVTVASGDFLVRIVALSAGERIMLDDFSFTLGSVTSPFLTTSAATITGLDYIVGSGPSASQSFDASGLNLDPTAGNVNVAAPVNFEVSLDNTSFFDDVDIAYTGGEFTDIPVYVRLKAGLAGGSYNGDITISGGTAANATVAVAGMVEAPNYTTLPYNQTFDTDLGDTYVYNVAGTTTWMYNTGRAEANGYNGSNPEEQWLVLPGIDFTAYSDVAMTFKTFATFGAMDANNYLKLFYSTDYAGVGDPTTATWTEVIFDLPSSITSTETETFSGLLDLSAINSNEVFLAFKYLSTTTPTRWRIDDINILEASALINASVATVTGLNYFESNGPSASQSFDVSAINLIPSSGNLTVTAPVNFEVSTDDVVYSATVDLAYTNGELAATPVYVRLQSGLTVNTYNGNVTITGGGANPVDVAAIGEVTINYDGMETFENFPETGASYNSGNFLGVNGNIWNYVNARGNIIITNETVTLQNNATASLNSVISGGLSSFSFDYMQAFSTNVNLEVYINGNLEATVTSLGEVGIVKNSGTITLATPVYGSYTIEFKQGSGGGQVAIDNLNWMGAIPVADYTWENGLWIPTTPVGNSTATDDLLIVNGTAVLDGSVILNNIYIMEGSRLEVENILSVNGDILNDGSLVFKSTSVNNTAQFDTFTGSISGIGAVTTERFIPALRAFRLLSSPVTTATNINANWQESAINATDDPNPGFGTHITGSITGANGFDATPSGNPSLFTLNNATQLWEDVTNTDVNTIAAGTAYRMLVRGDRSIDVTSNSATATNTTLRTTGTLHTGTYVAGNFSAVTNDFNFFGNPYQAAVDMNDVLAVSDNVNPNSYYIWDPKLGTRGAYATIELPVGTAPVGSDANEFLQPGQAAFVTTLANGAASLTFEEAHKNVAAPLTAVFSSDTRMDLRLFQADAFSTGNTPSDGLRLKFDNGNTNAITSLDAPKFLNLDENLASFNDSRLWSIENRALPLEGESIPLYTDQYRTTDYVFEIELTELTDVTALLRDHYTGVDTELISNDTSLYAFNVDPADANSIADDRFEIVFEELLGTNDVSFGNGFVLYPNPAQGEINLATKGINGDDVSVAITSITGQNVYTQAHTVNTNGQLAIDAATWAPGVYILKLTHTNGEQFTTKFIKK